MSLWLFEGPWLFACSNLAHRCTILIGTTAVAIDEIAMENGTGDKGGPSILDRFYLDGNSLHLASRKRTISRSSQIRGELNAANHRNFAWTTYKITEVLPSGALPSLRGSPVCMEEIQA
jgi:hypothetical protein